MRGLRHVAVVCLLAGVFVLVLAGVAFAVSPKDGSQSFKDPDQVNPKAAAVLARAEASGSKVTQYGGGRDASEGPQVDQVLTILVEFADGPEIVAPYSDPFFGPSHNQIDPPGPSDNTTYWVPDFSVQHYEDMLFGQAPTDKSMYTFYMEQSDGVYGVDGDIYGWYRLPHVEAYYGVNGEANIVDVLTDAIAVIGNDIDWSDYDLNGDGFVDHVQFVHAGIDESAGGPEWTIWAQSVSLAAPVTTADGTLIDAFTINPEDGTLGVFVHEYGHNIGLPDQYDTIYSGDAATGFWTLMSSGSWLSAPGEPLGVTPAPFTAWEKYVLGWVDPVWVFPGQKISTVLRTTTKDSAEPKAIRVQLPDYPWQLEINEPYSAPFEWWSGKGNNLENTLTRSFSGLPADSTLIFKAWYQIEEGWDYAYVQISTDGGTNWTNLAGNITTNDDPHNQNLGNGITGFSDGWVDGSFSLAGYTGNVQIRFLYWTDLAVSEAGFAWDNLAISVGPGPWFADSVPSTTSDWTADGWSITSGTIDNMASNYYMIEWREPVGYDVSMNNWYNFVGGNWAEFFKAYPGALIWYRTTEFTDNWVGVHPWRGQLLPVDSRPQRIPAIGTEPYATFYLGVSNALPARTRINQADATFSTGSQAGQTLTSWFGVPSKMRIPTARRVTTFSDRKSYIDTFWEPYFYDVNLGEQLRYSINSVMVPKNGVTITVNTRYGRENGGRVTVDYSRPVPTVLPWAPR